MRLLLASASPRRAALLREAGYHFVIEPADIDEESHRLPPLELARFLADAKARVLAARFPDDVTLAADTVVALDGQSIGKPTDAPHAAAILQQLAGKTHQVITAIAVHCPARGLALGDYEISSVQMPPLSPAQIDAYIATGLWQGKAGAYGIQDPNPIVTCLDGSISNVIGLPMDLTRRLFQQAGITPDNK